MDENNALTTETNEQKTWTYKNDSVNLNFTLNIGNSDQMRLFVEILKKATADVEKEIVARS